MWDLNQTERKALGAALTLIGLGLVGRVALAPGPTDLEWEPIGASTRDLAGQESLVARALSSEQQAQTPLEAGERIDPNTASLVELRRLPGVGPGLAAEIIRERRSRAFAMPVDLERVAGIGPATRRKIEAHLVFSRAAVAPRETPRDGRAVTARAHGDRCASSQWVDVNRATSEELEPLPGIGPALAARIVERRMGHGPFETLAALTDVRGIGGTLVDRLRGRACAGNP